MPTKPKKNQKELPNESQESDKLYTPFYATDIIAPYIPTEKVWECCAGDGAISKRLETKWNKDVWSTEINGNFQYFNFLTDKLNDYNYLKNYTIVTNPPFSIKMRIFYKCIEYDLPFVLLLPLDYSQWMCEAIYKYQCKKLIPTRRISFITPNVIERVNQKFNTQYTNYHDIPSQQISQISASQFHSGWLTRYFDFKHNGTEFFNELTLDEMRNNVI